MGAPGISLVIGGGNGTAGITIGSIRGIGITKGSLCIYPWTYNVKLCYDK